MTSFASTSPPSPPPAPGPSPVRRPSPGSGLAYLATLAPAGLAMAWLVTKAQWFWKHNPDLQFGWIVLALCAYLLWEALEFRPRTVFAATPGNLAAGVAGALLLFVTQIYQAAYGLTAASMSGLGLGVMLVVLGNLHFVFGRPHLLRLFFPFAFIFFALPIPSIVYSPVVIGLQSAVASINVEVLNILGIPARRMGSLIHLPAGPLGVDEACSGIRSLQSTLMATFFIGYLALRRPGFRLFLLGAGAALALLGNLVRSLFLSLTANARGIKAVDQFHDTAGWSVLLFTACGVGVLAWLLARLESKIPDVRPPAPSVSTSPTDAGNRS